ncbi:hypothetical protein [Streptomyces olivaceiscleroticus]|uniref:Lipoprotein n=1 Tax=Streptomyces olivaceiscleroticus TaxID=68245 RepID=A0ABN1BMS4_9ACTN
MERPSKAPTEAPTASAEVTEEAYPDTAEGRLDEKADEQGWESGYESAHAYIADMCESMTSQKGFGRDPGEWLMENQSPEDGQREILRAGMPTLCPKWWPTVRKALGGDYERSFSDGTYTVIAEPEDGADQIAPGTYRVSGDLSGCYWERATSGGRVIDNQFAKAARSITVTVAASDGLFTAEGCGLWKPVK